jgi:dolichol-phosphate mannosyltransferase
MRTLVIIPTYLEADNVADVLRRVRAAAPHVDILVVDDSSPDGTADLAKATNDEVGQIEVLVRPDKGGLGVAYRAGFDHAFAEGYEVAVQMDADLSHDPASLQALLARIDEGADVAIGSRYVKGGDIPHWPLVRRALSRIGNVYSSTVLGLGVSDVTSGFRAYRASVLQSIDVSQTKATGYGFQVELAYRAHRQGAKIVEVPITFNDRVRGESKMSWHIIGEAMTLVTRWAFRDRIIGKLRRNKPEAPVTPSTAPEAAAATSTAATEPEPAPEPSDA